MPEIARFYGMVIKMFHKISEIRPLPGLQLKARFADGSQRVYDVAPLQQKWPVFNDLTTIPGLFELVHVDIGGYGVVWNDKIDLASEEIWDNGRLINESFPGTQEIR